MPLDLKVGIISDINSEENAQKEILGHATYRSFQALVCTSKAWKAVGLQDRSWEYRFKRHFGHYVDHPEFGTNRGNYREAFLAAERRDYVRGSEESECLFVSPVDLYRFGTMLTKSKAFPPKLIMFFRAIKDNDDVVVKKVLEQIESLDIFFYWINTHDAFQFNALQWTIYHNYKNLTSLIFATFFRLFSAIHGGVPVRELDYDAQLIWLTMAIRCDQVHLVKTFLNALPGWDYHNLRSEEKHSVLHEACFYNATKTCTLLMKRFNTMYGANTSGETPLHLAAQLGEAELIREVAPLCDGSIIIDETNHTFFDNFVFPSYNALERAIYWKNYAALNILVAEGAVAIDVFAKTMEFALSYRRFAAVVILANSIKRIPIEVLARLLPVIAQRSAKMPRECKQPFLDVLFNKHILPYYTEAGFVNPKGIPGGVTHALELDKKDPRDHGLLHWIVVCNQTQRLQYRNYEINALAKQVFAEAADALSPLKAAVVSNNAPMCQQLVELGGAPTSQEQRVKQSQELLFEAIECHSHAVLDWLCQQPWIDLQAIKRTPNPDFFVLTAPIYRQITLLVRAVHTNDPITVRTLLNHLARQGISSQDLISALKKAAILDLPKVFKSILQHPCAHVLSLGQLRLIVDELYHRSFAVAYQFPQSYSDRWQANTTKHLPLAHRVAHFFQSCHDRQLTLTESTQAVVQHYLLSSAFMQAMLRSLDSTADYLNIPMLLSFSDTLQRLANTSECFVYLRAQTQPTAHREGCIRLVNALANPGLPTEEVAQILIAADNDYPEDADPKDDYIRSVHFCLLQVRSLQHQQTLAAENPPELDDLAIPQNDTRLTI